MPDVGSPTQSCPFSKAKEEKQDPKLHWVKLKLQDNSGKPVSNVSIQLTLPDGSIVEQTSDENGLIEVKNIKPGNCKIESDWKEYKAHETVFLV